MVTTRSSLPTGAARQTVRVAVVAPTTVAGKSSCCVPLILNSVGSTSCASITSAVAWFTTIQPCSQPPGSSQVAPSDDAHNVMVALRFTASLRATCTAAERLLANPFSLPDNDASLKFGTANPSRNASTTIAIISSTSVKPAEPDVRIRRVLRSCRVLVIAKCPSSLVYVPIGHALRLFRNIGRYRLSARERRIGICSDDERHHRTIVEGHHARHR